MTDFFKDGNANLNGKSLADNTREELKRLNGKVFALLTNYIDSPERAANAAENIVKNIIQSEITRSNEQLLDELKFLLTRPERTLPIDIFEFEVSKRKEIKKGNK